MTKIPNDAKTSLLVTAPIIEEYRKEIKHVMIAPFQKENAKGIGYNLSPSELVYSLRKRRPLPIHYDDKGSYVWINAHDTILTLSYEYVQVDGNISGLFLSKVRCVAKGLGNVSTTLDPSWQGMLLLSINNPTKRRMKLYVTEKRDGTEKRCTLITMVLWYTPETGCAESLTFHLDNPPMRADVWNELIEPPHRIWKNNSYHRFQQLVHEITNFKAKASPQSSLAEKVRKGLLDLEIAAEGAFPHNRIMTAILKLRDIIPDDGYDELREKFTELDMIATKDFNKEKLKNQIDLMRKECHYIALCDEVEQIHEYIHDSIEKWWDNNKLAQVASQWFFPYLPGIIASFILFVLLKTMFSAMELNESLLGISAVIPLLVSIINNKFFKEK